MDTVKFSTQFSPITSGIVETIRDVLLQGKSSIRVELYKLNVYGPGSFFKSHVDTPRGDKMFGSLVVVLPTKHEGGSLMFRHNNKEWTFDSAESVSREPTPHAAFAAFYSDVEHEVSVIESGYRVTLTYNLYFDVQSPVSPLAIFSNQSDEPRMKEAFSTLLNDPTFLPEGGKIGFGLLHKYPIQLDVTKLSSFENNLKGIDSAIERVCESLSLQACLKAAYKQKGRKVAVLLDQFVNLDDDGMIVEEFEIYMADSWDALIAYDQDSIERPWDDQEYNGKVTKILWVTPLNEENSVRTAYVAYGNEASLEYAYSQLCLIADVGPAGNRGTRVVNKKRKI